MVAADGQSLETGEAVGVLGQDDGVSIHADLVEVRAEVVGVVAFAEGVCADVSDVVILKQGGNVGILELGD